VTIIIIILIFSRPY